MNQKIDISYSNENNAIIFSTQDIQLKFGLSDYYRHSIIDKFELLSDGIIKFYVRKSGNFFEDFMSVKDSICGEEGSTAFDVEYQENQTFNIKDRMCIVQVINQTLSDRDKIKQYINNLLKQF